MGGIGKILAKSFRVLALRNKKKARPKKPPAPSPDLYTKRARAPKIRLFNAPNLLTNFTAETFRSLVATHPALSQYARQNVLGDGNCWLTAFLYASVSNAKRNDSLASLVNAVDKRGSAHRETYGSQAAIDYLVVLKFFNAVQKVGASDRVLKDAMSRPIFSIALRRFLRREVLEAGKRSGVFEGKVLTELRKIQKPNTQGEGVHLQLLAQSFGQPLFIVDTTNGHRLARTGTLEKHQALVQDQISKNQKLLLYTKGHYSVVEPKT